MRSSRALQTHLSFFNGDPIPPNFLRRVFREKNFRVVSPFGQCTPLSPDTPLSPGECIVTREASLARLLHPKIIPPCPHQPWVNQTTILFSTPSLLVINKPAGVDTQRSGTGRWSVEDALPQIAALAGGGGGGGKIAPPSQKLRILHRLDTPVSGILLLSRTLDCTREVSTLLRERDHGGIQKGYIGMVITPSEKSPAFSSSSLNSKFPLGVISTQVKTKDSPVKYESGTSRFCVLAQGHSKGHSLHILGLSPLTGRRHQLRQHVLHIFQGAGLYGDERYGGAHATKDRGLGLHASAMNLTLGGVAHYFHCPPPAWWTPLFHNYGLSSTDPHFKERLRVWLTQSPGPPCPLPV